MRFMKIEVAGRDFLLTGDGEALEKTRIGRMLDRHRGVGADGLLLQTPDGAFSAFGKDGRPADFGIVAALAAAKYLYLQDKKCKRTLHIGENTYETGVSVMQKRVLCIWGKLPVLTPHPMEQLRFYHGVRGEVLRSCLPHPRVSVYTLCKTQIVFLIDGAAKLHRLPLFDLCRRLDEALFFGEDADLHFAALLGEGRLAVRSWRCHVGEIGATGEGAAVSAYAAAEAEWTADARILVQYPGGTLCTELCGEEISVCAKCETAFSGEI